MIAALWLAASTLQEQPHIPPQSAVEWLESYSGCLEDNFRQVIQELPERGHRHAAERATIRCWPERSAVIHRIKAELMKNEAISPDRREEIAGRLATIVAAAFAQRVGVTTADLGQLDAFEN